MRKMMAGAFVALMLVSGGSCTTWHHRHTKPDERCYVPFPCVKPS
jgi:hypothetical protein